MINPVVTRNIITEAEARELFEMCAFLSLSLFLLVMSDRPPDSTVAVLPSFPCSMRKLTRMTLCTSVRRLQLIVFVWSPRVSSAAVDRRARRLKGVWRKSRPYRLPPSSRRYRDKKPYKLWVRDITLVLEEQITDEDHSTGLRMVR